MILLEQYIELRICHGNELRKYDVIEIFTDHSGVSFKIFYRKDYVFTLIPTMHGSLSFQLSDSDREMNIPIDWSLYAKIEASLYSIFLKDEPS